MKNIWEIFRRDIKRIKNNVIAMIVIMGITVVPCLYAWFNIAASWDPYKNTGNLKVAVASVDKGYEGSLIPLELNMGDQVLTSLRSNSQLDWVFTSKKKAVSGVKSGKYYAAIVIPENFSTDMMSLLKISVNQVSHTIRMQKKMRSHRRLQIKEQARSRDRSMRFLLKRSVIRLLLLSKQLPMWQIRME